MHMVLLTVTGPLSPSNMFIHTGQRHSTAEDLSNLAIAASDARILTSFVDTASTGQTEQAGPPSVSILDFAYMFVH